MKAMILAAGLGTRLEPLTRRTPKALVPVGNRPVIDRVIEYLKSYGTREIVVNAHHHSDRLVTHLDGGRPFNISIQVRVEPRILGTGGGIKNTADFWDEAPFVVINGDILTDIDLSGALHAHREARGPATLVLHDCPPFNQIRVDSEHNIRRISSRPDPQGLAFTGIHILDPRLLTRIPEGVFSDIIQCYRELIALDQPPKAHVVDGHQWRDIGTIHSYLQANREILDRDHLLLGTGCSLDPTARVTGWAVVGDGSVIEAGAELERSVLWSHVTVTKGVTVTDSVVTSNRTVLADAKGAVI